jgi:hypothetical protein
MQEPEFGASTLLKTVSWKDMHIAGLTTETGEKISSKMIYAD